MTWVAAGVSLGTAAVGSVSGKKDKKKSDQRAMWNEQAELVRQQQMDATRGQIDKVFDSPQRQLQYQQFADALRQYLGTELGRQRGDAGRNLKFSLAKQGLTGGSVDVDKNRRLGEEFSQAAIGNERNVQGELASLRGRDEQSRMALQSLAGKGLDLTTAGQRASEGASQNIATSANVARGKGLGDMFADTAATYKGINEREAMRKGFGYTAARKDLYGA